MRTDIQEKKIISNRGKKTKGHFVSCHSFVLCETEPVKLMNKDMVGKLTRTEGGNHYLDQMTGGVKH